MKIERKHVDLLIALATGGGIGAIIAKTVLDKKYREDVAFQIETIENTYQAALALRDAEIQLKANTEQFVKKTQQAADEIDDFVQIENDKVVRLSEDLLEKHLDAVDAPDYINTNNPYHDAVESLAAAQAEPEDLDHEYIDEVAYEDGDNYKGKIDILMDDGEPIFMMDGGQLDDWEERIGESILVDMFRLCPPGTPAVLYVRNHRTDEDYEVVRVEP